MTTQTQQQATPVNFQTLMNMIRLVETRGYQNKNPRYEQRYYNNYVLPAVTRGGKKFDQEITDRFQQAGQPFLQDLASSHGPGQIMGRNLWDMGYRGSFEDYRNDPKLQQEYERKWLQGIVNNGFDPSNVDNWDEIIKSWNTGSTNGLPYTDHMARAASWMKLAGIPIPDDWDFTGSIYDEKTKSLLTDENGRLLRKDYSIQDYNDSQLPENWEWNSPWDRSTEQMAQASPQEQALSNLSSPEQADAVSLNTNDPITGQASSLSAEEQTLMNLISPEQADAVSFNTGDPMMDQTLSGMMNDTSLEDIMKEVMIQNMRPDPESRFAKESAFLGGLNGAGEMASNYAEEFASNPDNWMIGGLGGMLQGIAAGRGAFLQDQDAGLRRQRDTEMYNRLLSLLNKPAETNRANPESNPTNPGSNAGYQFEEPNVNEPQYLNTEFVGPMQDVSTFTGSNEFVGPMQDARSLWEASTKRFEAAREDPDNWKFYEASFVDPKNEPHYNDFVGPVSYSVVDPWSEPNYNVGPVASYDTISPWQGALKTAYNPTSIDSMQSNQVSPRRNNRPRPSNLGFYGVTNF